MKFLLIIFLALSQAVLIPLELQDIEEIELNPVPTEVLFGFDGGNTDFQPQQYYDFDGKLINGPDQQQFISTDNTVQDQDIIEAFDVEIKVDPIENQNRDLSPQEVVEKEVKEELKSDELVNENQNQPLQSDENVQNQLIHVDEQNSLDDFENSFPVEMQDDDQQQEKIDGAFTSASFEMPMKIDTLYDSLGNQIDDPEGQKTYLEVDAMEIDLKKADRVIDVPNKDCIIIYSQCNYKGAQLEVCDSLKQVENFQHQIQSIHIPDGEKLTIFDQENYEGTSTIYEESTSCLLHPISLTQLFASNKLSKNLRVRK